MSGLFESKQSLSVIEIILPKKTFEVGSDIKMIMNLKNEESNKSIESYHVTFE